MPCDNAPWSGMVGLGGGMESREKNFSYRSIRGRMEGDTWNCHNKASIH